MIRFPCKYQETMVGSFGVLENPPSLGGLRVGGGFLGKPKEQPHFYVFPCFDIPTRLSGSQE